MPADLHSFGPLHRMTPSASWSQWLSQQSLLAVQVSPVSLHVDAGTSHLLFTQLSEQQSVFLVHAFAYARQVEQFTPAKQVVPKQQPFAHDVALHTHVPPTHCWPAAHCGPVPQLHAPLAQPSASIGSHEMHALPLVPQVVSEGVSHVLPEQQPDWHVVEHPAHTLLTHVLPPQSTHADPPAPQAVPCVPDWHSPLMSQQPAQFVPLHTHWPLTHDRPFWQAAPVPHMHCPPVHESAVVWSQMAQAPPPLPQVASVDCSHALPLQQPFGHELAVHWQLPFRHC